MVNPNQKEEAGQTDTTLGRARTGDQARINSAVSNSTVLCTEIIAYMCKLSKPWAGWMGCQADQNIPLSVDPF